MAPGLLDQSVQRDALKTFTFDPVEHRYFVGGMEYPGVSKILETSGLKHGWDGFHAAQQRGLYVHEACELLDLEDLDWDALFKPWRGHVEAYALFKDEYGFKPRYVEYQAFHDAFRFAGTVDREGAMTKRVICDALPDLKTGVEETWHRWQTAGYQILGGGKWAKDRRLAIYLQENGKYDLEWHEDPADLRVFLAALTITHAKGLR